MSAFSKHILTTTLIIIIAISYSSNAAPLKEEATLKIKVRSDTQRIAIGKTIHLTIDITIPNAIEFTPPKAETLQFPPFETRDAVLTSEPPSNGNKHIRYTILLTGYQIGKTQIPPVTFRYTYQGQVKQISTSPISIELTGATPKPGDKPGEIRGLKPPIFYPVGPYLYTILGILLVLLIMSIRTILHRLLPNKRDDIHDEAELPPHEWALQELTSLRTSDMLEKGQLKQFYQKLSDILRTYINRRYSIKALESTTPELLSRLRSQNIMDDTSYKDLRKLLSQADLVKFAKYQPPCSQASSDLNTAFQIIARTKPNVSEEKLPTEAVTQQSGSSSEEMKVKSGAVR